MTGDYVLAKAERAVGELAVRPHSQRFIMGTSIDCFFPLGTTWTAPALEKALDEHFETQYADLQQIAMRWHGPRGEPGWSVYPDAPPPHLRGEDNLGFSMEIHPQVVIFGSLERFRALYDERWGDVVQPLRRIIGATARQFGATTLMAVGAGGMGDTDHAGDVARAGATFEDVCSCLREELGPPAKTWDELASGEFGWYLGPPEAA